MSKKAAQPPKPRRPIYHSKYEMSAMLQENKKFWETTIKEIERKATGQEIYSEQLEGVLSPKICNAVCKILAIPPAEKPKPAEQRPSTTPARLSSKEPLLTMRKSILVQREMDSDTDVEVGSSDEEKEHTPNVHLELLKKPEREMITWPSRYLQPEKEEEKNLTKKADDLTDRISKEFCEFMEQLGGTQQSQFFTPNAIKELFKIEFDTHAARGLRNITKELPCVVEKVAIATNNPKSSMYAALEREIARDILAERRPDNTRGFNACLPRRDRWLAPRNHTAAQWRSAQHVPNDLVTLKTVWEGITHLRSVKEYCRWMIEHPQYKRAPYLNSVGMFDAAVLDARLTVESRGGGGPLDTRRRTRHASRISRHGPPAEMAALTRKLSGQGDTA